MKKLQLLVILTFAAVWIIQPAAIPSVWAKESVPQTSFSVSSPQDKLYALDVTRFHFLSLKQFHSSFNEYRGVFQRGEAELLNVGLNTFLISPERETLLLQALRDNKAVRLRFSVPEQTSGYEMLRHPTKPLLYRLEEEVRNIPVTIEIQPLLDGQAAFQITVERDAERLIYDVDWTGKVVGFARKSAV